MMKRIDVLLALLAAAQGGAFSPVQLQKSAFLISRNAPVLFDENDRYIFEPYNYGPFDSDVYTDAALLSRAGDVAVVPGPGNFSVYYATPQGIEKGAKLLSAMRPEIRKYLEDVSQWVRSLSFGSLVKSIYDKYPEMKANSIFQD